jgi:tetratricopeptide (TPR) repeat protein
MANIHEALAEAVKLHQAGNLLEAELLYREVLKVNPNEPDALHLLGVVANRAGRPEIAVRYIRQALLTRPGEHIFHSNIANAYIAAGDVKTAIAHYREALRLNEDYVLGHVYLSNALLEDGHVEEATRECLESLRLDPKCATAYGPLGELVAQGHYTFSSAELRDMHDLLTAENQSAHDTTLLHFALAAHHETNQSFDEAFHHYRLANESKQQVYRDDNSTFDPRKHRAYIDRLMAVFTPDFFERHASVGVASDKLVFMVGMVRSGTSLVEQILASHPQVFGAGERKDIDWISSALPGRLKSVLTYPDCLSDMGTAAVQTLAKTYLDHITLVSGGKAVRIIDKMTHNFLHLGLIALLFPRARIIHCRRDIMDVCTSAYLQNFKWLPYASSLEHIAFYYREYERLMAHWDRVLPLPVYQVTYEEMVANQEPISRNVVAFCGLPWHPNCLNFHNTVRTVRTASKLQVRQPMYTRSVARWRRFEAHLQPLRDALADADSVLAAERRVRESMNGARVSDGDASS